MKEITTLTIFFWIPVLFVLFKNILWDLYFWQIKEYRWDRFINHIKWDQSESNRNVALIGIKFILFAMITTLFVTPLIAITGILIIYILWVNEAVEFIQNFLNNKIHRPKIKSPRNLIILGLIALGLLALIIALAYPFATLPRGENELGYFSTILNSSERLQDLQITKDFPDIYFYLSFATLLGLFIDLASTIIVSIFVFLTSPIAIIRREITISKARAKYQKLKETLVVIGITGSQGKTTTKEILYELLKDEFKVAKTPENYNTDFGVASSILSQVKNDTEIFIAEMGAYKKGEIERMCKLFPPDVSIITDIDIQHLALFGSQRKVFEAKSEIIEHQKPDGISIINGDNEYADPLVMKSKGDIYLTFTDQKNLKKFTKVEARKLLATDIKEDSKLNFKLYIDGDSEADVVIPQKGEHLVSNFLLAIAASKALGVKDEKIVKKLKNLEFKLPRLSIDTGDNNTVVINDSYNSSTKGFIAAVNLMNTIYKGKYEDIVHQKNAGKRIVVTKGIYELGREKLSIYQNLLDQVRNKIDVLITSDYMFYKASMKDNLSMKIYRLHDYKDIIYKLREILEPNDIVLLEGKLHPLIIKEIVSDKF